MPFNLSISLLKNIVIIIDNQIKKDNTLNIKIKKENNIYKEVLKKLNDKVSFISSKLNSFQELAPTVEEIVDLKIRCDQLYNNLKSTYELLVILDEHHTDLLNKRHEHSNKWTREYKV
jgi:hypothetical protein